MISQLFSVEFLLKKYVYVLLLFYFSNVAAAVKQAAVLGTLLSKQQISQS